MKSSKTKPKSPWANPIKFPDALPISQRREEIAAAIREHQVVIVAGETGSGKTTQLPKICMELGYGERGLIGHTQPRRIAARTVAARIAEELNSPLGQVVGYQVRFKDQSSADTRIKLMTDGVLLTEFQHDRLLKKYDVIIIDEAHERSLNIDFLLGLLKPLCAKRPDLKVIITSATIDLDKFARHFANGEQPAPIIEVSGRLYPVETIYQPPDDDATNLPDTIGHTIKGILRDEAKGRYRASGDILVFCAGERDIRETAHSLRRLDLPVDILPLYSRLSVKEQNRVFQSSARRKVVLATNVAETSITVPGIVYVIDPGLARISRYSFRSKIQRLPIEPISQASANQRQGRCGRVANGVCIRLYSEEDFQQRDAFTPAEIVRSNLASVILKMLRLGIKKIAAFDFIDQPDSRLLNDGYKLLQELGAIDQHRKLTPTGRQMSDLPIDPRYARILVAANELGCLRDALVVISVMSIQDPRERPADKQQAADQKHQQLAHPASDFSSYLNLWQAIEDARDELSNTKFKQYCVTRFWSISRVFEWRELKHQLVTQCKRLDWKFDAWKPIELPDINTPQPSKKSTKHDAKKPALDARYQNLHRALLAGLISNIANKGVDGEYVAARSRKVSLFPGSSQAKRAPNWVVAGEFLETSRVFAHTVGQVQPEWIIASAKHLLRYSYSAPRYHVRSGSIKADRKTVLYGLILNEREPVNYAPINPGEARAVFIQQALVDQQYEPRGNAAPFVAHNQALIRDIEKLETKTRRRNLLVSEEAIAEFYHERLPSNLCSRAGLEKWLAQGNQDTLKLSREDLLVNRVDHSEVAQFPDTIDVNGKAIDVVYRFDPGSTRDGVTLVVPISILAPFPSHIGDWLVPGLLREKCVALIKTLPKPIRRHFAPASDAVDRVFSKLERADVPLHQALAEALYRTRGVKVTAEDFNLSKLDDYYRPNYRVIDVDQSLVNEGRDLQQLKQAYADAVQESVHASHAPQKTKYEQHHLEKWDFGALPDYLDYQHQGLTVRAYPMLQIQADDSISLLLHEDQSAARYFTQRGVLALAKNVLASGTQKQADKYLKKEVLAPKPAKANNLSALAAKLQTALPTVSDQSNWQTELIDAGLEAACFEDGLAEVRDAASFEHCLHHGGKHWVARTMALEEAFVPCLRQRDALLSQLNGINATTIKTDQALEDMKSQLYQLFEPTLLRYTDLTQLKQFPRYLRAIEMRIDKLAKTPAEESALLTIQTRFNEAIARLTQGDQGHDYAYAMQPALLELHWMLQEWRVSIYAQHLKTRIAVSQKRIEQMAADSLGW